MDLLAADLDEKVIIQRGHSNYIPRWAEHFGFTSMDHMVRLTRSSRLVVSHAAAGAVVLGLQHGKPIVVVPRLRRYGEHTDDHQLQLAEALSRAKLAIAIHDPDIDALRSGMFEASALRVSLRNRSQLITALRQLLQDIETSGLPLRLGRTGVD